MTHAINIGAENLFHYHCPVTSRSRCGPECRG